MKDMMILTVSGAAVIMASLFAVGMISRRKKLSKPVRTVITIMCVLIPLTVVTSAVYLNDCYHADPSALAAMESTDEVTVSRIAEGWFFDGSGTDTAIVFYPGGKVEAEAYAPLMSELASSGADCFLVEMPVNIAFLGINKADGIMAGYDYDNVYMAGHSLGGAAAANYCSKNPDKVDGLILLAAYSVNKIDDVKVLSVYGSEDGVLNMKSYQDDKSNLPDTAREVVIEGGCHAQFGCYGVQQGDGTPTISAEEQRRLTEEAVLEFIGK